MEAAKDLRYPKRLIEVDLPIARISTHARREKSIRHGHISTLHIWWARRPLAACRAVILASLWPDPAPAEDEVPCPPEFLVAARKGMVEWAERCASKASSDSSLRIMAIRNDAKVLDDPLEVRGALLDFIADFANWDRSTDKDYLEISRALTQAAHEALGGKPGTRPLVVDPFAGGGSIPLEALRVGADAYASDLNPVAVLLNKVVLEYIPKYGQRLADEVRKWGQWVKEQAEKELGEFYPKDPDGATPIAYLWARTIKCEGPGCNAEIPLLRTLWLAKKGGRQVALQLVPNTAAKRIDFKLIVNSGSGWLDQSDMTTRVIDPSLDGTLRRGSATCVFCGYTTTVARVREQLKARNGGASDARLYCIVCTRTGEVGRFYRLPNKHDQRAVDAARRELHKISSGCTDPLGLIPNESTSHYHSFVNRGPIYGMTTWADYFSPRQLLALATFTKLIRQAADTVESQDLKEFETAIQTCLALSFGRLLDLSNSLCGWTLDTQCTKHLFARQAIPMVWNFAEGVCIGESAGSWSVVIDRFPDILSSLACQTSEATVQQADAVTHPLPDDSVQQFITDPPYYYSVQYADLSDFFYVWLRRILKGRHGTLFEGELTPKAEEIIVQSPGHEFATEGKNNAFYEKKMRAALVEGRRILEPSGVAIVVFAHTSTKGWESILQALIDAGWVVTGSWPIDTEMASRVIAQGRAVLASSVHIVCRPRENTDGSVRTNAIGDWRDVLDELPKRIRSWMNRLKEEAVVGADAIFACLGPALEIFSRYARVEKSSGDPVSLREYLEHVWATVSHEAVKMIFDGAEAESLEADARLTTMWLWTVGAGKAEESSDRGESDEETEDEEDKSGSKKTAGFALEFDAARMIAQGLGIHLDKSAHIVQVKGDAARLLSVAERASYLFGKSAEAGAAPTTARKKKEQLTLGFAIEGTDSIAAPHGDRFGALQMGRPGTTVLDRLHQSMILFGAGRGEALRAFLIDDGHGRDERLWRLADSLSALYPRGTEERRWVEGVLSRKKALGL